MAATLPACEIARLAEIERFLEQMLPQQRQSVAEAIIRDDYIGRLLKIFRDCDDLEDTDSLHCLFRIFKVRSASADPRLGCARDRARVARPKH